MSTGRKDKKSSTAKPLSASDLIASATSYKDQPSSAALRVLDEVFEHNKSKRPRQAGYVTADAVMGMLASHGWPCSRSKLNRLTKERYGKTWGS